MSEEDKRYDRVIRLVAFCYSFGLSMIIVALFMSERAGS